MCVSICAIPLSIHELVGDVVEGEHSLAVIHHGHKDHDGHIRRHQIQVTLRQVIVQCLQYTMLPGHSSMSAIHNVVTS